MTTTESPAPPPPAHHTDPVADLRLWVDEINRLRVLRLPTVPQLPTPPTTDHPNCGEWFTTATGAVEQFGPPAETAAMVRALAKRLANEAEHFASDLENSICDLRRRHEAIKRSGWRPADVIFLEDVPAEARVRTTRIDTSGRSVLLVGVAVAELPADHRIAKLLSSIPPYYSAEAGPVVYLAAAGPGERLTDFSAVDDAGRLTAAVAAGGRGLFGDRP